MQLTLMSTTTHYRPQLLISGFLGAGKTTLLRNLLITLKADHNIDSDVILNDYENAELDAQTLQDKAAAISPLSASCACCGGLDDLVRLALAAQKNRSDLLLIELNGTADPIPLIETFTLLEQKIHFRPRLQVTVIDARKFGLRDQWQPLEDLQLSTATHYHLSHQDEVDPARLAQVQARITHINPNVRPTHPSELAAELATATQNPTPITPAENHEHEHHHDHSHTHAHPLTHAFNSSRIHIPGLISRDALWAWLHMLPSQVIRTKALVTLRESPDVRHLFERVGTDEILPPLEVPISDKVPSSAIFIGSGIDPAAILHLARTHLKPTCYIPQ